MTSQSDAHLQDRELADYGFAHARDLVFDAVQKLWRVRQSQGFRQSDIAAILGRDPAWVCRAMRGPGNWTLRTFGELVEALDGEIEVVVHDLKEAATITDNYDAYVEHDDGILGFALPFFAARQDSNTLPLMSGFTPLLEE